ncbi:LPS export ABC transporter permease LptF [Rickettsiella massiliensis]|uniref:LPS export ABC transporter permease LptF n=1 Tax=Rickettsiella massiliensis TaxID=676517 RepID=UPI00029B3E53|nr:LPS export ABC transporter permease LptF [Rickettsiella massiliensis]
MIVFRYLTRELFASLCLITSLLFLILISNEFVHYLHQIAGGKIAVTLLWKLVLLEAPRFLTVLLPFGLFLAILFTYGRLYADYEMTTLQACGLSLAQLTKFTFPLVLAISLFVASLNLWINPQLMIHRNRLLAQTGLAIQLETVQPGSFQQSHSGRQIIYVENISADHKTVKHLFIAQQDSPVQSTSHKPGKLSPPWKITTAESGYQTFDPATQQLFFIAVNGRQYQGTPGLNPYTITQFKHYGMAIHMKLGTIQNPQDALSSWALWKATPPNKPSYLAELHWRLAAPIATLLLALLAIPLSRVNPRQGKYLYLLPAIIIYIFYINLLLFGRSWIENEVISYRWGLWWAHAALGGIVLIVWGYLLGRSRVKQAILHLFSHRS